MSDDKWGASTTTPKEDLQAAVKLMRRGSMSSDATPDPLTCPCCGSDKTAGPELLGVLCWDCRARFRIEGGAVYMIECMCSRHDDGKVVKEVPSHGAE